MPRRIFRLIPLLLALSCGDPVEEPAAAAIAAAAIADANEVGVDSGFDLEPDQAPQADSLEDPALVTPNLCGGSRELVYQGLPALPSAECGLCKDGFLVCDGPNAIRCWGATQPNSCGTCVELPAEPGDACGICLDGEYECDDEGALVCGHLSELNACGGCGALDGFPGFSCEDERGDGVALCRSDTELVCAGANENACGGASQLERLPTQPCGPCNGGVTLCDGEDATSCREQDRWLNTCGGCTPLAGESGETCGLCGGSYACHPEDGGRVICEDPARTTCGGCEPLEGDLGDLCGEGERWHCDGTERVVCGDEVLNACGGEGVLDEVPGESCGPCGDGVIICASPEVTVCVDAIQRNICNGCSLLPGVLGTPCGAAHTWQCSGGDLSCRRDDGTSPGQIGDTCADLLECDSGLCLVVDSQIQEGFCSVTCADDFDCPDGFECEVLSQQTTGTLTVCLPRSLCVDPDMDNYGVGAACFGVDCDETDDTINEDAVDTCDGIDNDCDGVIDDNNGECGDPLWIQCLGEGRRASCQEIDACAPDEEGSNYCGTAVHWDCTEQPGGPPLCDDVNECLDEAEWLPECDFEHYTCADRVGAAPLCQDIDECLADNGGCDASFYTCVNTDGGRLCHDIDECVANAFGDNSCGDADQTLCVNQIGAEPLCDDRDACAVDAGGYNDCGFASLWVCSDQEGAPPLCEDYDECLVNNGDCDPTWERCVNRIGQLPVCKDINECLVDNGGCLSSRLELCIDHIAAAPTCEDYDDCQVGVDGTNACGVAEHWICTNNDRVTASCEDRDECTPVLGANSCGDDALEFLCVDNVGAAPTCTVCDGSRNLDGINDNGCEYTCTVSGPDICNHRDDDCDGRFDEPVALDTDPQNCGECGVTCALGERVATGGCVNGTCAVQQCEAGYVDADFEADNGCELMHLGNVIWVDELNGTAAGPGTPEAPFDTIQAGVAAAAVGDIVRVAPGSYHGPILVTTENLRIEGVARDDVLVAGETGETVLTVQSSGVSLAHFTVQGGDTGVWFEGAEVARLGDISAHDLIIRHQGIDSPSGSGLSSRALVVEYASGLTVSQLEISGLRGAIGGHGGAATAIVMTGVVGCTVTGNTIRDVIAGTGGSERAGGHAYGFYIMDSTDCVLQGNSVAAIRGGNAGNGVSSGDPGGSATGFLATRLKTFTLLDTTFVGINGGVGTKVNRTPFIGGLGGNARGITIDSSLDVTLRGITIDRMLSGEGGGVRSQSFPNRRSGSAHAVTIGDSVDVALTGLAVSNIDTPVVDNLALVYTSRCVTASGTTGLTIDGLTCTEVGRAVGALGMGVVAQAGQVSTIWVINSIISGTSGACVANELPNTPAALTVADTIVWECGEALSTNAVFEDGTRNIDPLLVGPTVGDLNVWPTSPAIDAGVEADDFATEPAPNGCRRNLGAFGATRHAISAPGADHCP